MSFEIDPREVLRLQGYRRPTDVPTPEVLDILQNAMAEARHLFRPHYLYQEFPVGAVGPEAVMGWTSSPCQSCDMRDCAYRRAPRRDAPVLAWTTKVDPLVLVSDSGRTDHG